MEKGLLERYAERGVVRFEYLIKHGVANTDSDMGIRRQFGKIIAMGDYEFEDYAKELIELRMSIVAELEAAEEN